MGGKTYILAFFHEEGDQAPGLDGDAGVGKWVEVDRSCKPTGTPRVVSFAALL